MKMRVGFGFDSHKLVSGRKMILGGVEIAADFGPLGVSDADVLIHSLCDALLGAMGEKDIGEHFPDDSSENKGRNSREFLEEVRKLLQENNYKIGNIDTVLILEKPKLTLYKEKIRNNLARLLKISVAQVSVKAKRPEGAYPEDAVICFSTVLLFLEDR